MDLDDSRSYGRDSNVSYKQSNMDNSLLANYSEIIKDKRDQRMISPEKLAEATLLIMAIPIVMWIGRELKGIKPNHFIPVWIKKHFTWIRKHLEEENTEKNKKEEDIVDCRINETINNEGKGLTNQDIEQLGKIEGTLDYMEDQERRRNLE